MDKRYTAFVLAYLKENHMNVFQEIENAYIPHLSDVRIISDKFCDYMGISINDLINVRKANLLNLRYKLIGAILYFYQPGKITFNERLDESVASELKQLLQLNTSNLNTAVRCSVNLFHYTDFKTDVVHFCNFYRLIK